MRIGKFRLRGIGRKRRYLLRGIGIGFWSSVFRLLGFELRIGRIENRGGGRYGSEREVNT
jgi:hypothetical protein